MSKIKRIGIDYSLTLLNRGMGRYVRQLVEEILKLDSENQYILYGGQIFNIDSYKNVIQVKIKRLNFAFFEQIWLPYRAKKDSLDILWSPGNTFPILLRKKTKLIVTIHDLIFLINEIQPRYFRQKIGRFYRRINLDLGWKRIDEVLTVSEYSKNEISKRLGIKKIGVTYNKIDHLKDKIDSSVEDITILNKLELISGNYYYTVTGDAESKNLKKYFEFFRKYQLNKPMVISGVYNIESNTLYKTLSKEERRNIILTDIISDEEMIALYRNAKAFIFLSKAEGFGIPVLEAMLFNLPIICSNRTSLPEIVGKGGVLVDPDNDDEILGAINSIGEHDYSLEQNNQVKNFMGWDKTAKVILNVFNEL